MVPLSRPSDDAEDAGEDHAISRAHLFDVVSGRSCCQSFLALVTLAAALCSGAVKESLSSSPEDVTSECNDSSPLYVLRKSQLAPWLASIL